VRASEFLVEYNRQVTAKQVGDRVLDALHKDRSADVPYDVALDSFRAKKGEEPQPSPEQKQKWIEAVLAAIEAKDPTSNKAYTPWLAKMYVKGGLPIEDMNRNDMLRLYDIAKKRRMIKPEHTDINRFKWYQDFEDTMENDYDNLEGVEQGKEQEQGAAKKVYEDDNVMVIVPEDEAAACKYGRNTRWCTAATRGYNYFDQYNRQGPLYILIPKKPEHEGEKYQLHFPTSQYMDEDDDSVSLLSVFHRFPELTEFFMKNEPGLKNNIVLMDNDQLQSIIDQVSQLAIERMDEEVSEWETADDSYRGYLLDTYPDPDEEGSIDWEKVEKYDEGYLSYNDDAWIWIKKMTHALTPTPNDLKTTAQEMATNGKLHDLTPEKIPNIMAEMVKDEFRYDLHLHDGDIPYFLKEKVLIKNNDGNWSAQVVYSQPVQARRR
jgi:hypothetical protein